MGRDAIVGGVLSIAKLTPGQEGYYERSVADGLDDYYAGRGESPGVWTGRGARELELEGLVHEGELGRLIRGLHPHTEKQLRTHPKARVITIERIDPLTDERSIELKKLAPVAGFDLVFSPPKSVSLLHALGDEETRRAVQEAHLSAWQAALSYLEDEACVVRRGKNGVRREHAGGFVAAAYQHRTSRAQDPHLHTHVIVANMAQSPADEKWRALIGRAPWRGPDREQLLQIAQTLLGPDGLTQQRTAFTEPDAVMAWAEAHRSGAPGERLRTLAARIARADGVERVGELPGPGRPARYSTNELLTLERAALALVERGRDANAPTVSPERLEQIERADRMVLSAEQERMVRE